MIQGENGKFLLACLGATASVLGCVAISVATMAHAQVQTPRFYASSPVIQAAKSVCAHGCSAVVISK